MDEESPWSGYVFAKADLREILAKTVNRSPESLLAAVYAFLLDDSEFYGGEMTAERILCPQCDKGKILCPQCSKGSFFLDDEGTHVTVSCRSCGFELRQLDCSWFAEFPRWRHEADGRTE